MERSIILIFLVTASSCMEMKETVERMVMVRTTGSDLQPAATGFIYKKDSDGPESVIKMGESEVMEHLAKLYEQPKAFAAPIPIAAGPFYAKEEDENKAASDTNKAYIKPVVEESKDDHIDGIADEDYEKGYDYAPNYAKYKEDFNDYIKSLGYFEDDLYHENGEGKGYGAKGHHEYGDQDHKGYASKHHYGKGGAGDYHSEKHESFSVSKDGGDKKHHDEADAYGKHYEHGKGYKGSDHGYKAAHSKGEAVDGFHKKFNKNEYKKDHDFYDGEAVKGGFHKFADGHAYHGSDAGEFKKGDSHKSGHDEAGFGKGGFYEKESGAEYGEAHSGEEKGESYDHHHGDFGAKGGLYGGKSFGYEIKH